MNEPGGSIPLTVAAQRLGMSWDRAWRLLLQGDLAGEKADNGRWQVTAASVEALKNGRAQAAA